MTNNKQLIPTIAFCSIVLFNTASYANVPEYAKIKEILGPNDLSLRRGRQLEPVNIGTKIRQLVDALFLPGNNRTFAQMDFYNKSDGHLGLAVQASTKNKLTTLYYFPCTFANGDSMLIEWKNQKTGRSACEKGIRLQPGKLLSRKDSQLTPWATTLSTLKQTLTAQNSSSRFKYYCSVMSASGNSSIGIKSSGDPCQEPLQQCQASKSGQCDTVTLDRWLTKEPELSALVSCANNQQFTTKGTGSTIEEVAKQLWQQAQTQGAKSCVLHVLGTKDLIATPIANSETTLIQINNNNPCLSFSVITGAAIATSTQKPEGVALKPGQKYIYCDANSEGTIETFDPKVESIEVQVFRAPERGYQFCDKQQASGGQEGDKRTIQLTANEGEIRINYEMFTVPDRLRIIYEGADLTDTEFVSGNKSLSIPFKGNSGQVSVELTGNQEESGTKWNYTLYCPL